MKSTILVIVLYVFTFTGYAQRTAQRNAILRQMKEGARAGLIDVYYPRNLDSVYGGYLSTFSYDIQPVGPQDKMIVTQARHIWSTSRAASFYKDTAYIAMARHGFEFLRDKMWDKQLGGFYNLVDREGHPKSTVKEAYGNAFGIYALAAYYKVSHDSAALNLARAAFNWLETHSHDPVCKGYYQHLTREGVPVRRPADAPSTQDIGYKDQNSSIHLLEALTELYSVWKDPLLAERLREMLLLIRDTMVTPKGYLQLYFNEKWEPVSYRDSARNVILKNHYIDHVSFGHDVETAYLMQEASEALGGFELAKTMAVGKRMVDHALNNGWDKQLGGFYDEGYYFKDSAAITIINESKNWWSQAEGLNTLLIFADTYPVDGMHYEACFEKLWAYVQTYLIDHVHGDWYEEGLDTEPQRKTALKAHIWKGTYHNFRALSNCIERLRRSLHAR